MKTDSKCRSVMLVVLLLIVFVGSSFAAEVTVEKKTVSGVVLTEDIIKTADNFIVMFDSSGSMAKPYKNTGLTTLEAAEQLLIERNEILPDLGYNAGLYLYTPFKPIYPIQRYNQEKFAQAIEQLPKKASGGTLLQQGLHKLDGIMSKLSGRTVVFLFTDGSYTRMAERKPVEIAKRLANKYNVCFYLISTAKDEKQEKILKAVASINACSRVVPFDQVFAKPVYLAGALFVIEKRAVPFVSTFVRIADFKIENILFDFDKTDIRQDDYQRLNLLGTFLKNNPKTYAVLTGFTDSVGASEYNLELARRRAESVEGYLISNLGVDVGRIVTQWYGKADPIASNDSPKGRQLNRRVECMVMGMD
ncbi:MAG: OmpA family protein [Desulfobacterales bacterium]|nr:MAG: OmpA family protein [Desulfobacterales bacterium]